MSEDHWSDLFLVAFLSNTSIKPKRNTMHKLGVSSLSLELAPYLKSNDTPPEKSQDSRPVLNAFSRHSPLVAPTTIWIHTYKVLIFKFPHRAMRSLDKATILHKQPTRRVSSQKTHAALDEPRDQKLKRVFESQNQFWLREETLKTFKLQMDCFMVFNSWTRYQIDPTWAVKMKEMAIRQSTDIVLGKIAAGIPIELPTGNDSVGFWCEATLSSTRNRFLRSFVQQKKNFWVVLWWYWFILWFPNSHSSCFGFGGIVESCASCGTSCAEQCRLV